VGPSSAAFGYRPGARDPVDYGGLFCWRHELVDRDAVTGERWRGEPGVERRVGDAGRSGSRNTFPLARICVADPAGRGGAPLALGAGGGGQREGLSWEMMAVGTDRRRGPMRRRGLCRRRGPGRRWDLDGGEHGWVQPG
jgi:hypothetical protein